jgi:nucleotide-binding universal stress UspA family protein
MSFKNILVAVDESETSEHAANEAIKLAKDLSSASIRIIHVVDPFFYNWGMQPILSKEIEDTKINTGIDFLKKVEARFHAAGIKNVESKLVELQNNKHRIDERIVQEADEWPADMIVMGTHGRRGFHRFLIGSVAESIVRISDVPILLIHGNEE